MKQKQFHAWGIDTRSPEGHGVNLIGRYWHFGDANAINIPNHLRGCRSALFTTRQEARENLKYVKGSFDKARVVKVYVTLEWDVEQ